MGEMGSLIDLEDSDLSPPKETNPTSALLDLSELDFTATDNAVKEDEKKSEHAEDTPPDVGDGNSFWNETQLSSSLSGFEDLHVTDVGDDEKTAAKREDKQESLLIDDDEGPGDDVKAPTSTLQTSVVDHKKAADNGGDANGASLLLEDDDGLENEANVPASTSVSQTNNGKGMEDQKKDSSNRSLLDIDDEPGLEAKVPASIPNPNPSNTEEATGKREGNRRGSLLLEDDEDPRREVKASASMLDLQELNFAGTDNATKAEEEKEEDDGEAPPDPDEESSDEEDANIMPETEPQVQKRKLNAAFEAYRVRRALTFTDADKKESIHTTDDYRLSMAHLLEKHDFATSLNDPREYQIELFERAKAENIIAVLDTGSGKTLIAILLLRHIIEQELEDRAMGKSPRISFFLVDSVTLIYQQAAVLQANINQPIDKFCGAMGTDLWNKEVWAKHFEKNMVIACTAEVLYQCLLHSYLRMEQINLLIFDEAHHAKKDHPYARILKDFYFNTPKELRPKVFGMTASPVDAKTDVIKAAESLESLLDSRIATTSNLDLLRQTIAKPKEEVWRYGRLSPCAETDLYKTLKEKIGNMTSLAGLFTSAMEASSSLGPWCADLVFFYGLSDDVLPKLEGRVAGIPSAFGREQSETEKPLDEEEITKIREAGDLIRNHDFGDPFIPGALSPKVRYLLERLVEFYERPTDTKCIVFVRTRYAARVLCDVFKRLGNPNLHPDALMGHRAHDTSTLNLSAREQLMTMVRFRKGETNCIFATSIAEEGLDIPDCNLVIRFDLYSTVIQYIQSRGRARHRNSLFVQMVEIGNQEHEAAIKEVFRSEERARRFCSSLPEDRLLDKEEILDNLMAKEAQRKSYTVPGTGAKLTFNSAIQVLAHYADSLRHLNAQVTVVTYVTTKTPEGFLCEAILPEEAAISGAFGQPSSKKAVAKQSAAFETCVLLRKNGALNEYLGSTVERRRPVMRNAHLAINSRKTNQYTMKTKPSLWAESRGQLPTELHAMVLSINPKGHLQREYQPLVFLTRQPMPKIPVFSIYLEDDVECEVVWVPLQGALNFSSDELTMLTTFTMNVFRDAFHKRYEHQPEMMSYWLAPTAPQHSTGLSRLAPRDIIDWTLLRTIQEGPEDIQWAPGSPHSLIENKFIYDPWDGRYRYFTSTVEPGLKPSDPVQPDAPKRRNMDSILSYSLNLFKKSRKAFMDNADWEQPVVKARLLGLRRNLLDKATEQEKAKHKELDLFICTQPLRISAIPIPLATTIFAFPAIIYRLEAYLIAQEACQHYGLDDIPLELALEAVTKDSDNTEEHRAEQVHFQRGMGKNYERLEFLGDCFLKMATSISLFALHPDNDEFDYHVDRMLMLCNANMFNHAVQSKLYEYVRSQSFSRRNWYPDGLNLLQGKTKADNEESRHPLADKTIADICEALIGASVLTGGRNHRFDLAVKAVTAFVKHENHDVPDWAGYEQMYKLPQYQITPPNAVERDLAEKVEALTGYKFKYPRLLRSAFRHPSFPTKWATVPTYQRLEFLGDSLFDMVCVEWLYEQYPDKDPQWLTEHKMAMVSNKFLGSLCVKLGFNKHLQHNSNPLIGQITSYVTEVESAIEEAKDAPDAWNSTSDPPKALADMVEAYVGAIFIDSNFKFETVQEFFNKFVKRHFEDMTIYDTFANKHPVTFLHNRLALDFGCQKYSLKAGEIPYADGMDPQVLAALYIHDQVVADNISTSVRYAKIKTAQKALDELSGLAAFQFRARYGCDCQTKEESQEKSIIEEESVNLLN